MIARTATCFKTTVTILERYQKSRKCEQQQWGWFEHEKSLAFTIEAKLNEFGPKDNLEEKNSKY